MEERKYWERLKNYTDELIKSKHPKKLIVSGPGTGKTTSFKKLLKILNCSQDEALVLTFINNLKGDLEKDLSGYSSVYTFHGYCLYLLKNQSSFWVNISKDFEYYPSLTQIVISDWSMVNRKQKSPKFVAYIRRLEINRYLDFFIRRANYYNAIGYDDSVLRVYALAKNNKRLLPKYKQIIVDEFQDFNLLEAELLNLLSEKNSILIAGDDDQALYCNLRFSDPSIIRSLYNGSSYKNFELPYCMRCTEVIVGAVNDLIASAKERGIFRERLPKKFEYFPPKKQSDSERFPYINLVHCSIQKKTPIQNNFFGRYIAREINNIPRYEAEEALRDGYPTVLIIGSKQYRSQINEYLKSQGFNTRSAKEKSEGEICREDGIKFLAKDPNSNLGWRIILECDKPKFFVEAISKTINSTEKLKNIINKDYADRIVKEAEKYSVQIIAEEHEESEKDKIEVVVTSFEGSKGLSAQRVFIVGLQNGDLPRDKNNITDIEVCRLLVALTRTRKCCSILYTNNFSGNRKEKSILISWINNSRFNNIKVDKNYW
jgi:superfamily I DNA/RNA helicase